MKFKVCFNLKSGSYGYPVAIDGRRIGTDDVIAIRKEAGCNVPLGRISDWRDSSKFSPDVELNFETALEVDQLKNRNTAHVCVPDGFLNEFVEERISIQRDKETGEVLHANLYPALNSSKLLEAWIEAGYPDEWGFDAA